MGGGGANTLGLPADTGESSTTDGPSVDSSTGVPSETTTSAGDESTTSTTTGEPGEVALMISDGPVRDFGDVPTGGQTSALLTVSNEGDADAEGLTGSLEAPFSFVGGFPGDGGSCGTSLPAGESCTVEVTFAPEELGFYTGTLAIGHAGGPDVMRELEGGAEGQSENLLVNAGGEDQGDPPPGWTAVEGHWIAGVAPLEAETFDGTGYLYGDAGMNNVDNALQQDVAVDAWGSTIDAGRLRVAFEGQARAYLAGEDEHRIRVHYLDAGGATLQLWTSDYHSEVAWEAYADTRIAPVGTRTLRVELNCRKDNGVYCNAYFDALELRVGYP